MRLAAALLRCLLVSSLLALGFTAGCEPAGNDLKPAPSAASPNAGATTSNDKTDPLSPAGSHKPAELGRWPGDRKEAQLSASNFAAADPLDWPNWRGPEQNSTSRETGLIDHWNPGPDPKHRENVLWVNEEAGGISAPIVMQGKLYMINRYKPGTRHEGEQILCLDAATGKILWHKRHNMYLSDVPAERIGWASIMGDPTTGRIYAYGTNCLLQCLDGETGEEVWSHSLHEEFGFLSVFGGRTNFPIVFEDTVIVSAVDTGWGTMAPPAHRFLCLDKNTGEVRWFNGTTPLPEDTTYSTPTIAVVDGQLAMVFGSSDGSVWAFQPRTGKPLWHYHMSRRGMSVSPLVVGDTIYMAQNEENLDNITQGMLTAFHGGGEGDITGKGAIWQRRGVMEGKSSPILVNGRIYAAEDSSHLVIVDAATGKLVKRVKLLGEEVRASPLYADGKIYICSTTGWNVFRPTAGGVEVVQQFRFDPKDEVSAAPIVSHGRIYLATGARLYCLGTKDQKPAATPIPPARPEPAPNKDDAPAEVQIVPAEVLLNPGHQLQLRVRLFNKRGQFLRDSDATYTLDGPGEIEKSGVYRTSSDRVPTATIVTAKVGQLTGQARIRVVPPLPWKFDFQQIALKPNAKGVPEGLPPITWIGLRYRHVIRELDGRKVMVKVNTIPKGTRSQGWMGQDTLHDYTIQADARATTNSSTTPEAGMPDIGLIAQRYTMALMGADQKIQIRYWPPQVATQFSKDVSFPWKPNVWYTMKFRADNVKGRAVLRGKVWPRGERQPDGWTIEAADDEPNIEGSPGLFGDTSNKGEFQIDNIRVYSNTEMGGVIDDVFGLND